MQSLATIMKCSWRRTNRKPRPAEAPMPMTSPALPAAIPKTPSTRLKLGTSSAPFPRLFNPYSTPNNLWLQPEIHKQISTSQDRTTPQVDFNVSSLIRTMTKQRRQSFPGTTVTDCLTAVRVCKERVCVNGACVA